MRPIDPAVIDAAILRLVAEHPRGLAPAVATMLGVSKPPVIKRIRALVETGFLLREGGSTRPIYSPGPNSRQLFEYSLSGLAEDRVWSKDVSPLLKSLHQNVVDIAHHGLTEMVNNAIDHSSGTKVFVYVVRDPAKIWMRIQDNGVGIFKKISEALGLPDERLALLELSKGKLTTDPQRHSGEGIFFTSRMFDEFVITSGELSFNHDESYEDDLLFERDEIREGTTVDMLIRTDSKRDIADVFKDYSSGPDDYSFAKTIVPVRLARIGGENLISRSQAKRLMQRVDRFKTVVLDFDGVEKIGQAFADEIFRVFANAHPEVELIPGHATPEVQQMIRRAEVLRDEEVQREKGGAR
jgi:anti-sigma regulatory factor (Ser/Thr protein kinase)